MSVTRCLLLCLAFFPCTFPFAQTPSSNHVWFEENLGQWDESIQYLTRLPNRHVRFVEEGVSLALIREIPSSTPSHKNIHHPDLDPRWFKEPVNRREAKVITWTPQTPHLPTAWRADSILPEVVHYLIGEDSADWVQGVHRYRRLRKQDVWPQIDWVFYESDSGLLAYDLWVNPGGKPSDISFSYDGADSLHILASGDLEIHTEWGIVLDQAPIAYQLQGTDTVFIASSFVLRDDLSVGFHINGDWDRSKELIIDPLTLNWSTFFHHSDSDDYLMGIAKDAAGYLYACGYTKSTMFPVAPGIYQASFSGVLDGYIAKFTANGSALLFATYLGGSSWEIPIGIHLDAQGDISIAGYTQSSDFPTTSGVIQPAWAGGQLDGFMATLSASGSQLVNSSYFGGGSRDYLYGMDVDASGNWILAGYTYSSDFPVTIGAYQTALAGDGDAWVAKFSPDLSSTHFCSFIGGSYAELASSVLALPNGQIGVVGSTGSADFPVTSGAFQTILSVAPGYSPTDGFVSILHSSGSQLIASTYLGGTDYDEVEDIEQDLNGDLVLVGRTGSTDFPTTAGVILPANDPSLGSQSGFVAKISSDLSNLSWATCLGGSLGDFLTDVEVNLNGEPLVVGASSSTNYPVTFGSPSLGGNYDVVLSLLNASGTGLLESRFIGGMENEYPRSAASLQYDGYSATLAMTTHSTNMPMVGSPYQGVKTNGSNDAPWLAAIDLNAVLDAEKWEVDVHWDKTNLAGQVEAQAPESWDLDRVILERMGESEIIWEQIVEESAGSSNWNWTDQTIGNSGERSWYYRVKGFEKNGTMRLSEAKWLNIPPAYQQGKWTIGPNPVHHSLSISAEGITALHVRLEMIDMLGSVVATRRCEVSKDGAFHTQWAISQLSAGVYGLTIRDNRSVLMQTLIQVH
ncbi:hypothetical protein [Pontibacter sp. G13]|uniref:DUF7948 domain-containing protein n=1 Tax=Pontibacter sp. G13 TaxID=3074898 RepID=UPI002889488F|nr:hypothetical protein [Pontibacter sp. G13]WNJ16059.1 hypothetical protein RJD25_14445 [Pontibacter sp. G13]